jgi:hypothetical protein
VKIRHRICLGFLIGLLTGCIGHYRYESVGTLLDSSGQSQDALLYWAADDGRLWYGKRYFSSDSDVSVIICGSVPTSFGPVDSELQLFSESGDRQIARLNAERELTPIDTPQRLVVGSSCGELTLDGLAIAVENLTEGVAPEAIFWCDNANNPNRYPRAQQYLFGEITRTKVSDNDREPVDVCSL